MLKKADNIFKWIILGVAIAHLMTYFMPIYKNTYTYSDPVTTLVYMYSTSSYVLVNFSSLLIPIVTIVFLFVNFKNSKLFFFGFSATYIINCIFTTLSLSKLINDNTSSYNDYSFVYGYYFFIVTMVLLALVIIGSFVIYVILKHKELKSESEQKQQVPQESKIDILRKRIEVLDDLKNQELLTESEYEEKRAEIIKELRI